MSKKSKKQSRKTPGQRTSIARPNTTPIAPAAAVSSNVNRAQVYESMGKGRSSKAFEPEFNPDYSQTIKDLRRIGILAGSFFLVLIVLSFFLR